MPTLIYEDFEPFLRAAFDAYVASLQTAPLPAEPPAAQLVATLDLQGTTSGEWSRGFSTMTSRLNFPDNAANRSALLPGRVLRFGDGTEREITKASPAYNRIYVDYAGTRLPPIEGLVEVFETATPGKPEAPAAIEPAQPEVVERLPLIGLNFAGLGNNPSVDANFTASAPTNYRTIAPVFSKTAQPDYVQMYSGHLSGEPWLARIPFAGERIAVLDGKGGFTLRARYVAEIRAVIARIAQNGGQVLLDMHNYCRWYIPVPAVVSGRASGTFNGKAHLWTAIGSAECPVSYELLGKIWAAIAREFKHDAGVWGWGLMNEPHNNSGQDLKGFNVENAWKTSVQGLINAVREVDLSHWITVAGLGYSSAKQWPTISDWTRLLTDPVDKLIFEAHQYADKGGAGGGAWKKDAAGNVMETEIDAAARVADWDPFLNWLNKYRLRGLAGEFGGPGGTPSTDEYFRLLWDKLEAAGVPGCQWLAGPGDSDTDGNGMDRNDGTLKPNAAELMRRIGRSVRRYGNL